MTADLPPTQATPPTEETPVELSPSPLADEGAPLADAEVDAVLSPESSAASDDAEGDVAIPAPVPEPELEPEPATAAKAEPDAGAELAAEVVLPAEAAPAADVKLPAEAAPAADVKLPAEAAPAADVELPAEAAPAAEVVLPAEAAPAADVKLPAGVELELEPSPEPEPAPAATESEPQAEPEPAGAETAAVTGPGPAGPPSHVVEPVAGHVRRRTAARFIAEALAGAGVRIAYTVPGESFLPLLDELPPAGIRVVAARHEGGASFMAAGAAALTGRPVVILGTRSVGATNMAIGLHTALADSAPVIALVGQVRRSGRGRDAFQEIDLVGTIGRLCRWATEVRDIAALPGAVDEALRRATTGRPGPVLLSLPEDLLEEEVAGAGQREPSTAAVLGPPRSPGPDPTTTRRVMRLLLDAERPVILAGAGVLRSRGTADLVKLAELVDVPVVAAWRRPDVFPNEHSLYLGMTGLFAAPTVRERLTAADAVLVVGCRLNEVASFGWSIPGSRARWAHVDLEPLGARAGLAGPTIALSADARTFLREARRVLNGSVLEFTGLERRRAANAVDRAAYEAARQVDGTPWDGPGVHPGRVIATLNAVLAPDAIVTTDAGHFAGWGARGLVLRRPGTYLGPTSGAMGYGIPAAIAASLANPGRPVIALVGDGGAAMTFAELETAVRERAHPIVLVFDNARYGTIRDHQDRLGHAPVATDLGQVDWAAAARAFGADGVTVEHDDELEPALRAALAGNRTTVIHLLVDRRWVSVDRLEPEAAAPDASGGDETPAEGAEVASASSTPAPAGEPEGGPEVNGGSEPESDPEPEGEATA